MELAGLATETLTVVDGGGYTAPSGAHVPIEPEVRAAISNTRCYRPEELGRLVAASARGPHATKVFVTPESTGVAGQRLIEEGEPDVAVLNFASGRRIGGGFLGGAKAQEEELCRASALFRCLETQPTYYAANRAAKTALYTDHLIYSPRVPFFRDAQRAFVEKPYLLSVITAPAPNTGAVRKEVSEAALQECFFRRAAMVLAVAADQRHEVLVLGAWGCGAFQGDPVVAAEAFGAALSGPFAGHFRTVVFAVLVARKGDERNLTAFQARHR